MRTWEKVLYRVINTEVTFREILKDALSELDFSVKEFSKVSKVPKSTLYKIMATKNNDTRLSNARDIIRAIKNIEQGKSGKENVIALVTDRGALENMKKDITVKNKTYNLEGYPATNIEEAMIQGINAERDGVKAIICGPIAAYTLERVVKIPVISLRLKPDQLQSAVDTAVNKII